MGHAKTLMEFIGIGFQSCKSPEASGGGAGHSIHPQKRRSQSPQGGRNCSAPEGPSMLGQTHRGVGYTAGEGHPTLLAAVAGATAVEVDVEVPVFRAICPTALVLQS